MKGRKNGCPVNVRNWLIYILDNATQDWIRIYGLTSMSNTSDSDTSEGSADTDEWKEPYVTKRGGSISLEGKPVVEASTGDDDLGQSTLTSYGKAVGCDADATLKFVDPYGHAWVGDYIVTSTETSTDSDGTTLKWSLSQVGEIDVQPYVHVSSIALKNGEESAATISMKVGDSPKIITVNFTPSNSSNIRFRVSNNKRSVVSVSNVTENGFTLDEMGVGTATVTVTTVDGNKSASIAVTVTAE